MDKRGVVSTAIMLLGTLLLMIGAGLPAWTTRRRAISDTGSRLANSKLQDFDCTVGAGLFRYNYAMGQCGDCEDDAGCKAENDNVKSNWESFSTTSIACKDLEEPAFVAQPGSVIPPTMPPSMPPTTPPTPPIVSEYAAVRASSNCNNLRTAQAFSVLAILFALAGTGLSVFALKGEFFRFAALACILSSGCAFSTFYMYRHFVRGVLTIPNSVFDAAEKYFKLNTGTVTSTYYGPAYGCEMAGAVFVGFAGILLFIWGEFEERGGGSSNKVATGGFSKPAEV